MNPPTPPETQNPPRSPSLAGARYPEIKRRTYTLASGVVFGGRPAILAACAAPLCCVSAPACTHVHPRACASARGVTTRRAAPPC